MANRTTRTIEKDAKFITALSSGKPIGKACQAAGYGRSSVYEWRHQDQDFDRCWREAEQHALELMEAEADRRAMRGTLKPVYYKGEKCGAIREYSDTLLIFRLKALAPEKYRDRHELTGPNGGPVQLSWVDLMKHADATTNPDQRGTTAVDPAGTD